jgi:hypothetical protein
VCCSVDFCVMCFGVFAVVLWFVLCVVISACACCYVCVSVVFVLVHLCVFLFVLCCVCVCASPHHPVITS